jgi:hypothetical protein
MKRTIKLNEDHLKLIPYFFVQDEGDNLVFFDRKQLFSLGSHLLEDIAFAIGKIDEAIPNTKDDAEGRAFPDELETYMLGLYNYLSENLISIETLIHQFAVKGGLSVGEYVCDDTDMIWSKI